MDRFPYLKVYKDGTLVDAICLQGENRWIAGRHAECGVVVAHASISRRHLEIQVLHATRELLLMDLHSAHGTMMNGEALTPARLFVARQGDTVQIGASTRSYKVDWVPIVVVEQRSKENRQQLMKGNSSVSQKDENFPSSTRTQVQRGCRSELPPRTPVRRLPFATVPASTLNVSSPQSPAPRKANSLRDKIASSDEVAVTEDMSLVPTTKEAKAFGSDGSAPANLWQRRCTSALVPALIAPADTLGERKENEVEIPLELNRKSSGGELPHSLKNLLSYDEYPSDKENYQSPKSRKNSLCWDGRQSCRSTRILEVDRQPFADLHADFKLTKSVFSSSTPSSPHSDFRSRTLGLPPPQRQATSAMVNNLDSLFGKLQLGPEGCCQWHIVVDTNCLLDMDALESLKKLEGVRETRVIIPKIVLRELDGLKRRHEVGLSARAALRWIENCMEEKPFWMHVQRSREILPVRRMQDRRFISPVNDDHILECVLLFGRDGRVVLLTRDTALKIKAMAEGVVVDDATSFCESLLSPYSDQFLWLGSTGYRPSLNGPA